MDFVEGERFLSARLVVDYRNFWDAIVSPALVVLQNVEWIAVVAITTLLNSQLTDSYTINGENGLVVLHRDA